MTKKSQLDIWEKEHQSYQMFPFLDGGQPNSGVVEFVDWLERGGHNSAGLSGLEICCGNGRNASWLAGAGFKMSAFDFSRQAIRRAKAGCSSVDYLIYDVEETWPYTSKQFDIVIDCFGSSEMESPAGLNFILDEAQRVLKPGGYYFLQIDTPEIGFFKDRLVSDPGGERNTLVFPNGKVESVMTEDDLRRWSHSLQLVTWRTKLEDQLPVCGIRTSYKYLWIVAQAPKAE